MFRSKYDTESAISLNTTSQTKFVEIKNKSQSYYKPRKSYDFQFLYRNFIDNSYNEIDTCGFVIHISTNSYQDIVYLANTNKTHFLICILFPKNSDVFQSFFF